MDLVMAEMDSTEDSNLVMLASPSVLLLRS